MNTINTSSSGTTYINTITYPGISTTGQITTSGTSTTFTTNQLSKIKVPGTDLMVNDDWQNNMCAWFLGKHGIESMVEFIEEHPTYLEFLDKSFANYLRDMKKIVNRDKKILQILG
jgi:hypothetical protein